ncbi:hypothetical protein NLG97_g7827 [Lecanicillium saksenae]|uniref:Uncharacterized protein n=1 Tax=Lecanicillium saksenae TaxID=468837 RepID=A0ACC1QN98_9HYPO|nr:hypothetical protein NLG97_g7827 [Lecanicillium saksenae]
MFGQPHPRTLHLYYRDGHHQLEVCDEDKQTVLYRVYRTSSKPHLTVCRAPGPKNNEEMVGQISFHHFKSDVDLNVPGNPLSMKKAGFLSSDFEVHGDGIAWKWERDGAMTSNIKLTAADGSCLAKFDNASWSRSKQGTLTVMGIPPTEMFDALIVTGLAKIEYQRRSASTRNGSTLNAATVGSH